MEDHYLFCYPDDYAQAVPRHDPRGRLIRNSQRPILLGRVYVFDPKHGSLELSAKGSKKLKDELQELFCDCVLHAPGTAIEVGKPTYGLDGLLSRGFPMPIDPNDRIEEVRVKSLCLSPFGPKRRITVEADPSRSIEDVYDAVDETPQEVPTGPCPRRQGDIRLSVPPRRGRKSPGRSPSMCPTRVPRHIGIKTTNNRFLGSGACGDGGSSKIEPFRQLLSRADDDPARFDGDEVANWPAGGLDRLIAMGFLIETYPAESVACDACGENHVESVRWIDTPDVRRRAYIVCPEAGRVPVDPDRLRQWNVSGTSLAVLVAEALGTAGGTEEVDRDRVWKLGRLRFGAFSRVLFLIRGLERADGAVTVETVPELFGPTAIIFVPDEVPPESVWGSGREAGCRVSGGPHLLR